MLRYLVAKKEIFKGEKLIIKILILKELKIILVQ